MSLTLYDYQQRIVSEVMQSWQSGLRNILVALPTAGGKTVILAEIMRRVDRTKLAIAHRQELVIQMSTALARNGISHRVIGPSKLVRLAQRTHSQKFGRVYVDPRSNTGVASVQTLARRNDPWLSRVQFWVTDEAHHLQPTNQWGRALETMGQDAIGLGLTATPYRADGKGLDGTFNHMVIGPSPRELINRGFLSDFIVYSATVQDLGLESVPVGASGDYVQQKLKKAIRGSQHLVGNVVYKYMQYAAGKLGATFATDVETAGDFVNRYRACGIPAEIVTAKTPADIRSTIMDRFERREILQLVTVDIISEGFDLPALEVASMARPTESKSLYHQQLGRLLRRMEGKDTAILIDHVGNTLRHLPPEYSWPHLTLAGRKSKREEENPLPVKACPNCSRVHEKYLRACPYCGFTPEPVERSRPEEVDGDLQLLTAEALEKLVGRRQLVDRDPEEVRMEMTAKHAPAVGVFTAVKRHKELQEAQQELRNLIAWFGGWAGAQGMSRSEGWKYFYLTFGVDVLSAQGLKLSETKELKEKISNELAKLGCEVGCTA